MGKSFAIWITERLAEVILGTGVLLFSFSLLNPQFEYPDFDDVRQSFLAILIFYVSSGFVASAFYFGYLKRSQSPSLQAVVMASLFAAHFLAFMLFLLFWGVDQLYYLTMWGISGCFIVAAVNFIGSYAFHFSAGHSIEPHSAE